MWSHYTHKMAQHAQTLVIIQGRDMAGQMMSTEWLTLLTHSPLVNISFKVNA